MKRSNRSALRFAALCLAVSSLCSCINNDTYLYALPDDFQMAVKIAPQTIFDKAALKDNFNFKSERTKAIDEILEDIETKSLRSKVKLIAGDAYETGLDFSKPAIGTFTFKNNSVLTLVMAVKDVDKLADLCAMLEREADDADSFEINEYSDGCYIGGSEDEEFIVAFNSKSFVLYYSENDYRGSKEDVEELLNQKSILKESDSFRTFVQNGDDFGFWVDGEATYAAIRRNMDRDERKELDAVLSVEDMEDLFATGGISFENGRMVFNFNSSYSEELANQSKNLFAKADASLFDYLPGNSFIAANVNLSKFSEVVRNMPSESREQIKDGLSEFGLTSGDFKGNATIGLAYDKKEDDYMLALAIHMDERAYRNCKEELENILSDLDMTMSFRNGVVSILSDALLPKSTGGKFSPSFADSRYASNIADGGFVLDAEVLGNSFYSVFDEHALREIGLADYLSSLQFVYPSYDNFKVILTTGNSQENILQTISKKALLLID